MEVLEQKISGMLLSTSGRTLRTLLVSMPIVEIEAFFSTVNVCPDLQWVIDEAANPKNAEKVKAIQNDLEKRALDTGVYVPLTLTFAVEGRPVLSGVSGQYPKLSYRPKSTYIVGNVLTLVAICRVLGVKSFLFSSRLSSKDVSQKSLSRQRLAMEEVEVRIIFDDEKGLSTTEISELFKNSSLFDSALNLPHISGTHGVIDEDFFPLKPFILQLIEDVDIESYGGVSFDSKHVKVSERYVTTHYILFKLLVGAVAGVGAQEYSKMPKDLTLTNGDSLTSVLSGGYMEYISAFIKGWLNPLKIDFISNRSGYQLSPQVWQALGLVIHHLVDEGMSPDELLDAGLLLGSIDYSKSAKHWKNCSVMELDVKGRIYKNATHSTRLFRVGLKKYFLKVINEAMNNEKVRE